MQHDTAEDLDRLPAAGTERAEEMCALDEALERLAQKEPRRAQVIELRFFAGLSVDETAEVLGVSAQTVCVTGSWRGPGWRWNCTVTPAHADSV